MSCGLFDNSIFLLYPPCKGRILRRDNVVEDRARVGLFSPVSDIVAAHVSNNEVPACDLPALIGEVSPRAVQGGRGAGPRSRGAAGAGGPDPEIGQPGLHRLPGRRQEAEDAETAPDDRLQPDAGGIPCALESTGRLSLGCPQLCAPSQQAGENHRTGCAGTDVNRSPRRPPQGDTKTGNTARRDVCSRHSCRPDRQRDTFVAVRRFRR